MTNNVSTYQIPHHEVRMAAFDHALARLPEDIQHYVVFDAPKCLDPATVLKAVESGYDLEWIKNKMKRDAIDVYGAEYFR